MKLLVFLDHFDSWITFPTLLFARCPARRKENNKEDAGKRDNTTTKGINKSNYYYLFVKVQQRRRRRREETKANHHGVRAVDTSKLGEDEHTKNARKKKSTQAQSRFLVPLAIELIQIKIFPFFVCDVE